MLIQALINKKHPSQLNLALIYQKILQLSQKFHSINFYHVLCGLNALADIEANKGVLLSRGILNVDGVEIRNDIPWPKQDHDLHSAP